MNSFFWDEEGWLKDKDCMFANMWPDLGVCLVERNQCADIRGSEQVWADPRQRVLSTSFAHHTWVRPHSIGLEAGRSVLLTVKFLLISISSYLMRLSYVPCRVLAPVGITEMTPPNKIICNKKKDENIILQSCTPPEVPWISFFNLRMIELCRSNPRQGCWVGVVIVNESQKTLTGGISKDIVRRLGQNSRKIRTMEVQMCLTKFHSWKWAPAMVVQPDRCMEEC